MAISVVAGIVVLSFIAFAVWCMRRKQRKKVSGFGGYVMPSPMASSPQSGKLWYLLYHVVLPLSAFSVFLACHNYKIDTSSMTCMSICICLLELPSYTCLYSSGVGLYIVCDEFTFTL